MIYNEVTKTDFHDSEILRNDFSYQAIEELFEWYNQFEEIEFDPIAMRCEWSEYEEEELFNDYGYLLDEDEEQDIDNLIKLLQDKTTVIGIETTYLIQEF